MNFSILNHSRTSIKHKLITKLKLYNTLKHLEALAALGKNNVEWSLFSISMRSYYIKLTKKPSKQKFDIFTQ